MAESTEDSPRYSIKPGEAEEIQLLPGQDIVAYRLDDDDHLVELHIVAPIRSPINVVPTNRFDSGGFAETGTGKSMIGRAAIEQVLGDLCVEYGLSGAASYRSGHEYIELAIKPHAGTQPFSIEFNAPPKALGSSGDGAGGSSGLMD
jgi:hypothetical protein